MIGRGSGCLEWFRLPNRSVRIQGLVGVLMLQGCFVIGLLLAPRLALGERARPGADRSLARMIQWRRSLVDPARDPRVGSRAPELDLLRPSGKPVIAADLAGRRWVLLFAGNASGCSLRAVTSAWAKVAGAAGATGVALVVNRVEPELQSGCDDDTDRVTLFQDRYGYTARRWNAGWSPRAYVVEPDGSLGYVQALECPDSEAPTTAAAQWVRSPG